MTSLIGAPQGTIPDRVVQHAGIPVRGLSCVADARRLEHGLQHRAGVLEAVVNPVTERAYIIFDGCGVTEDDLRQLIRRLGFEGECPTLERF